MYVCDGLSRTIKVTDREGHVIKSFGSDISRPGLFQDPPWFITIYKESIVVSDKAGMIHQFTKSGSYIWKMDIAHVRDPTGVTVTTAQDLLITDRQGPIRVVRGEQTVSVIGKQGAERLHHPLGVAVSKTGQIIVANCNNNNLLVYDLVRKIYPK